MARIQGQFSNTPWLGTRLEYYEKDYSVENNTSTVHVDAYILSLNGGYTTGEVTVVRDFYVTLSKKVDNNDDDYYLETKYVTVPRWTIVKNEVWKIGEFEFTVPHAPDGSRTIDINSSYNTGLSGIGASELSAELTLTKIARQSTVSCPDFNIGSATTINISRANENYKHTVTYQFGSLTGTIVEKTSETSLGWTPDANAFFQQIPNDKKGQGKLFCTTYSEDTQIGVTTEYTFNAMVIDSEPVISATIQDTNSTTVALTGNADVLVKYMSNANVVTNATAQNYASIKAINVTCDDGKTATGGNVTLNGVENGEFTITATDSREYSSNIVISKTMINYIPVSIKTFVLERPNPTSNYLTAQVTGNFFNGSFGVSSNSLSVQYRYKEAGGTWSSYTTISASVSANGYTVNTQLPTALSYQKQWEVELLVSDKLASDTYSLKVSKGIPTVQKSEREFQVNGTIYQADENGQNAVSIATMIQQEFNKLKQELDSLKPVTLFSGTFVGGTYISIPNLSSYKKLEIYWEPYGTSTLNTGGSGTVLTVTLDKPFASGGKQYVVAGQTVPYCSGATSSSLGYSGEFSVRVEVNITDNSIGAVFFFNANASNGSEYYKIYKIVGYK